MAIYSRTTRPVETDEPMFVISVAARLVEMHPQTLRYYERAGLVKPTRSRGRIRLYSQQDIDRLRKIARLVDELGVNLAGVEVILNLTEKLEFLQQQLEQYQIQLPEMVTPNEELQTRVPRSENANARAAMSASERVTIKVRRPRALPSGNDNSKSKRSNRHG